MFLKVIILLLMCSKYSIGQSTHDRQDNYVTFIVFNIEIYYIAMICNYNFVVVVAIFLYSSIYTIVCENSLLAGERFRIYVTIYNGSQPVELRVTLNHTTLKQNPTEIQRFLTIDPHKGFSLDIDIPSHWKDGYYNLQILGSGGVNFTHERELHLINHVQHFIIKIMVDKEVYSIGDRGTESR